MPRDWPRGRGGASIRVAVVAVGLVLVAYGLGMATWVSSSDSSTRFVDLSYGDPPYGFNGSVPAEVVARPYFNGGAWVLLVVVAVVAGVAIARRTRASSVTALLVCLVAVGWTVAAVAALVLVDLQFGARLPAIGYLLVAGAMFSIDVRLLSIWVLFTGAALAAAAAVAAWWWPVNSFDSSCSLATRNRFDNEGACGDFYRTQWILFVGLVIAAIACAVSGAIVAKKRDHVEGSCEVATTP